MQRQMLKSKIHRATVTGCDVDYVGSVTVDRDLLDAADILANEHVHVWDSSNGARFVTYAIEGERGAGDIQINGAAALLVVVHVDAHNRAALVDSHPEILLAHGPSAADEIPGALGGGEGFDEITHFDSSLS